jgi:hypothetical protein
MRVLVERLSLTSRRTYQKRGQRLVDDEYLPIWQRILKDGSIIYRPDTAHPVFADFSARLPTDLQAEFATLIGLLGSTVPVASLHADFAGQPEEVRTDEAEGPAIIQLARAMIPRLLDQGTKADRIPEILQQIDPFRSSWTRAKPIIEEILRSMNDE